MTVARLHFASARSLDLTGLAEVFSRAFVDYFVPVRDTPATLARRLRVDSIDLDLSRVILAAEEPVGLLYLAPRGWSCRIAGMGVVPEARRQGVGRDLLAAGVAMARQAGYRRLVLEVIEENLAARALYEAAGFRDRRRLVGFERDDTAAPHEAPRGGRRLVDLDPRHLAQRLGETSLELPWQLAAESLAALGPPARAYQLDEVAAALVEDPALGHMTLLALWVDPAHRRQGHGRRLVEALRDRFPRRHWRIPARIPQGLADDFLDRLGFAPLPLAQREMVLDLRTAS